jgi:hypothetical protein
VVVRRWWRIETAISFRWAKPPSSPGEALAIRMDVESCPHRGRGLCTRAGLADVEASGAVMCLLGGVEFIEENGGGPGVRLRSRETPTGAAEWI